MSSPRFVILVLDGLRPDLITPERMPNLCAFRDGAAVLGNSRSQFPTHTRVNKVSLATGAPPAVHGIHFNKIYDPALLPQKLIDLGDFDDVRAADGNGDLITARTVGAILADAGKRFALVHCGMSGAPSLLNYRGECFGQEHLALAGYPFSTARVAKLVESRLGPMPSPKGINLDRSSFAIRALTEVIYPELQPDVSLIWSDEPDKSAHADGLRGEVTERAFRHCDDLVGQLVSWWRRVGAEDGVNLFIVSDHGHVEISGRVPLLDEIAAAGLPVTTDPLQDGPLLVPFGSGGIYLRGKDPAILGDIVGWMQRQPWCGNLFTDDRDGTRGVIDGTFSKALVSLDHPRAPDLLFTTRRFDRDGRDRPLGHCLELGSKPAEGSTHGGLHAEELMNIVFVQGPEFREAHVSEMTGGLIDIVPTMLSALGIAQPEGMRGRPLAGLMRNGRACEDMLPEQDTATVSAGDYRQGLRFRRLARRTVVDHGWRD